MRMLHLVFLKRTRNPVNRCLVFAAYHLAGNIGYSPLLVSFFPLENGLHLCISSMTAEAKSQKHSVVVVVAGPAHYELDGQLWHFLDCEVIRTEISKNLEQLLLTLEEHVRKE
ncbi:hypothetical protein NC653_025004 [Populus alba x Populus x berolinensis]|uniref:Uncharacterized protein n=1 Tax=Populus alba x Populus x berolinensis TaxID=444605 RepID=A0AAD6MA77_9ROSI|nr:hypothetical protein NC653_025004 [Populus alba x Populus x berolinensis]